MSVTVDVCLCVCVCVCVYMNEYNTRHLCLFSVSLAGPR